MEESVTIIVTISQKELDEAQIEETPYKQKSGRIIEQTEVRGFLKVYLYLRQPTPDSRWLAQLSTVMYNDGEMKRRIKGKRKQEKMREVACHKDAKNYEFDLACLVSQSEENMVRNSDCSWWWE